jgi:CRISPR-associated protein Cmr1
MGSLTLHLDGDKEVLSLLAALFLLLERWGSIGAKPQLGYGVFGIKNQDEVRGWAIGDGKEKSGWAWRILGNRTPSTDLPDLRRFGFFRYRFDPQKTAAAALPACARRRQSYMEELSHDA